MRDRFIKNGLDTLVRDIGGNYFIGQKRNEYVKKLEGILGQSYDNYVQDHHEKGNSYVSKIARYLGGAANVVGDYMFWTLGGAGFGFKGLGALLNTGADIVDASKTIGTSKLGFMDYLSIAGESLLTRAAAYLPFGIGGLLDFSRGIKKFEGRVANQALMYAKDTFLKEAGIYKPQTEQKVVPLDYFAHPTYI